MSYLSLVYGGGIVLSSAAALGATYLGNMVNPVEAEISPISPESKIIAAFGGGERGKLALEILKYTPSKDKKYSANELLAKMEEAGLDVNELAECSEETRIVCGLLVKKLTDIINQTANPSKFIGLGDQTQEAIEILQSSQSAES
jgi:hypothetical protein